MLQKKLNQLFGQTNTYSSSAGKESTCNAGDLGSIPGLGRSPGEGNGYLLQYSGLENSMDSIVHGVTKSWTQLSVLPIHVSDIIQYLSFCVRLTSLSIVSSRSI